jgi:hypothetical protein
VTASRCREIAIFPKRASASGSYAIVKKACGSADFAVPRLAASKAHH